MYEVLPRMRALRFVWNPDAHEAAAWPSAPRYPPVFILEIPVLPLKGIFECSDYDFDMSFDYIIIIIIIIVIIEFLTSQLWL